MGHHLELHFVWVLAISVKLSSKARHCRPAVALLPSSGPSCGVALCVVFLPRCEDLP